MVTRNKSKSKVKTWMKRNRFKQIGWGSTCRSKPTMNSWMCRDGGHLFRIRFVNGIYVVDAGEHKDDFDRWANSSVERDIDFDVFVKIHQRYRGLDNKL